MHCIYNYSPLPEITFFVHRVFISAFATSCLARKCSFGEEIVGKCSNLMCNSACKWNFKMIITGFRFPKF